MNYSIRYSSSDVLEQIFNLPISLQARYIALTQRMIEYGPHLGLPHTNSFGGGLFELRLNVEAWYEKLRSQFHYFVYELFSNSD